MDRVTMGKFCRLESEWIFNKRARRARGFGLATHLPGRSPVVQSAYIFK